MRLVDEVLFAFNIPGTPGGAERHRTGKGRQYHTARHLTREGLVIHSAAVAMAKWDATPFPIGVLVALHITGWFIRPQSRRQRRVRGEQEYHGGKPDVDNLAKLVMDGMTKAGVWADDKLVTRLVVERQYIPLDDAGLDAGQPHVAVSIYRIGGLP